MYAFLDRLSPFEWDYSDDTTVSLIFENTTADDNTAVGAEAVGVNTTGHSNTAVGAHALDANTTANNNGASLT